MLQETLDTTSPWSLITLGWSSRRRRVISLAMNLILSGSPLSNRTFFNTTIFPVVRSFTLYTLLYVPCPICPCKNRTIMQTDDWESGKKKEEKVSTLHSFWKESALRGVNPRRASPATDASQDGHSKEGLDLNDDGTGLHLWSGDIVEGLPAHAVFLAEINVLSLVMVMAVVIDLVFSRSLFFPPIVCLHTTQPICHELGRRRRGRRWGRLVLDGDVSGDGLVTGGPPTFAGAKWIVDCSVDCCKETEWYRELN